MTFAATPAVSLTPLLWVAALLAVAYVTYRPLRRFRQAGVRHSLPAPLLGDIARVLFGSQHVLANFDRIYNGFPGERFVGMSESVRPVVVVRDLELARRVTVRDFDHFQNHSVTVNDDADPVFGKMIFSIQGQEWREMRSLLGRFFTSLKLRQMVPTMAGVGDRMVAEIRKRVQESKANCWDTDIDVLSSHSNFDIIVSCILGLKLNSRDNTDIYEKGYFLQLKSSQIVCFLGFQIFPNLMKVIGINMFAKSTTNFFKKLFIHALETRKDNNSEGRDFIDFVLQLRKEKLQKDGKDSGFADELENGTKTAKITWSDTDWYAQALALLVAGFDPVAAALGMLVHELALHPEIQERLVREVRDTHRAAGGRLDYNTIQQMPYMDMVVSELLRMWANSFVDRTCSKDYNLGRPNDSTTQDYIIRKNEGLYVPIRAIHYDPQYFPEPARFDPERFSEARRRRLPPFAYNPFGAGPRMCMGPRFATCVIKVLIYQLLRAVQVSRCEKTSASIQLDPASVALRNKGGSWVRLTLRE